MRPLGVFESTQVRFNDRYPFNVVGVVRLLRAPSPIVLERALGRLGDLHPLLGARVVERGRALYFEPGVAGPLTLRVLPRADDDAWRELVEAELMARFDAYQGPMFRAAYLAPQGAAGEGELVLTLQHAIADAASVTRLVRELLSFCAAFAEGGEPGGASTSPVTAPADALFPPSHRGWRGALRRAGFIGRQMADEMLFQWRSRGLGRARIHPDGRCRILVLQLPQAATRALVERSRRERVTLNSVLGAALLLAVKRRFHGPGDVALRNFVMANLRPYLQPPLTEGEPGSYFAMLRLTTLVAAGADLWGVARELNEHSYLAARRGDKFSSLLLSGVMMGMVLRFRTFRMGHTALSYTGVADLPETYGDIRIRGLHGFVSNFPLGPEHTAQARLFAGRLWWDIVFLDSDMDYSLARAVGEDSLRLLGEASPAAARQEDTR